MAIRNLTAEEKERVNRFFWSHFMTPFDPREYALAKGWDFRCIEDTATNGLSDYEREHLTAEQCDDLLTWCRYRVDERNMKAWNEECDRVFGAYKARNPKPGESPNFPNAPKPLWKIKS